MLDEQDNDLPVQNPLLGILRIMALFAVLALAISWFAAYAGTHFLLASDLMRPWTGQTDPRPRWMLETFLAFLAGLILLGGLLRAISRRQLKRIDRMLDT